MASVIEHVTRKHRGKRSHATEDLTDEFKHITDGVMTGRANSDLIISKLRQENEAAKAKKKNKTKRVKKKGEAKNNPEGSARSKLGEYLIQVSKLYEAMDIEPDVRMLRDHLHAKPPMHSRRTLDQSYYWKLANTDNRDEDQVVYRATMQGKNISRTTRVVMVDQLWLYILDESTCLPSPESPDVMKTLALTSV